MEEHLSLLPDLDFMHVVGEGTTNYLDIYPDRYDLPDVEVTQKRYEEGNLKVVERTFHTPAGNLSDRTKIAPRGREYGVSPNPIKTEHLVKGPDDLEALKYTLCPINTDFSHVHEAQRVIGDRGVVMVCVRSSLDHNAGYARDMQDLMMDAYDNRAFLNDLMGIYQQRSLEMIKSALEAGVEVIFGSWYFNSVSSGCSPALFKELFVPQIREHVELTHSYDACYDYYDDGKLADTMQMISDAGVDVLETCTPPPVGDFDLSDAKKRIGGKTTIKGCVDLLYVIKHGTPQMVDDTVKQAMADAKSGGGFIVGSSDSFREGTPPENLETYWRACRRYGNYS